MTPSNSRPLLSDYLADKIRQALEQRGLIRNWRQFSRSIGVDYKWSHVYLNDLDVAGVCDVRHYGPGQHIIISKTGTVSREEQRMVIGFDPGAGKCAISHSGKQHMLLSQVSIDDGTRLYGGAGVATGGNRPVSVETADGKFWVGNGAHDYGHPVENLDFERLTGSPEMRAMYYAALSRIAKPGELLDVALLVVGLPNAVLKRADKRTIVDSVKAFMGGAHTWVCSGKEMRANVQRVNIAGQPIGALMEFMLTPEGTMKADAARYHAKEVGVVNIGASTLDLSVVRDGRIVERFTDGNESGARQLLAQLNTGRRYSMSEMDARARAGQLELNGQLNVWWSEINGAIDELWGRAWPRYSKVILCGGGVYLLQEKLQNKFGPLVYSASNPVLSTAIGLERIGLWQEQGRGGKAAA